MFIDKDTYINVFYYVPKTIIIRYRPSAILKLRNLWLISNYNSLFSISKQNQNYNFTK